MKHFLMPENFSGEAEFHLDKEDSHYLKNVLRLKEGDSFKAVDRSGEGWNAVFSHLEKKRVILSLKKSEMDNSERSKGESPEIILCQCLPKGKKMDLIVRQATEAGVAEIQPLMSEFSLVSYDKKGWKAKEDRYSKIAREAFQQSGSNRIPVIKDPIPLTSLEIKEKDEIGLFFHQISIENISLHKYLFSGSEKIILIIGPEGGLSDNEIKYLREMSFQPAYLGYNVLRTETAALYAVAAVKTILLERETWKIV